MFITKLFSNTLNNNTITNTNTNNNNNKMAQKDLTFQKMDVLIAVYTNQDKVVPDFSAMTSEERRQYLDYIQEVFRLNSIQLKQTQDEIKKLTGFDFERDFPSYDLRFDFLKQVLEMIGFDVSDCKKAYQLLRPIRDHNIMVELRLGMFRNDNPIINRGSGERRAMIEDFGIGFNRSLAKQCIDRSPTLRTAFGNYMDLYSDITLRGSPDFYNYRRLSTEFLNALPDSNTSESERVSIETGLKQCFYIIPECLVKKIAMKSNDLQSGLEIMNRLKSFINERI